MDEVGSADGVSVDHRATVLWKEPVLWEITVTHGLGVDLLIPFRFQLCFTLLAHLGVDIGNNYSCAATC